MIWPAWVGMRDAVHVLYAGRSAEWGPAGALFAAPRHPYTRALLLAAPVLGVAPSGIAGQLPEPEARAAGCRFAPRCAFAAALCAEGTPPVLAGATQVACRFPLSGAVDAKVGDAVARRLVGAATLLRAEGLTVRYGGGFWRAREIAPALADASFVLAAGECLAVVGESGSGKSLAGTGPCCRWCRMRAACGCGMCCWAR
ncbi:MAG: oligopeptide/dipeptide ABC transporter ATP-binding protein [Rhodospirillales bacterium]